jgi:hypothetical protein
VAESLDFSSNMVLDTIGLPRYVGCSPFERFCVLIASLAYGHLFH